MDDLNQLSRLTGCYGNQQFLVCFEDIWGYHGNQETIRRNVVLSSDRTL